MMNINANDDSDEDNAVERRSSKVIFDIKVLSDRTSQPPLLCIAQYFDVEDDLHRGLREVQRLISDPFDFALEFWHVFDHHSSDHIHSPYVQKVFNEFKDDTKEKSLNDLFSKMVDEVINNVIKIIKY